MIGERYAATVPARQTKKRLTERIPAAPSIALRERFAALAGNSFHARLVAALSLVFVAAVLYLAQASDVSVKQFTIVDLQQQHLQLSSQNANLWAHATSLQAQARIETIATTKLHMATPDLKNILWVRPVMPQLKEAPTIGSDTSSAVKRSEPLSWMGNFVGFLRSEL